MDKVTQQNAAMAEEATAASSSLAKEADQLASLIQQFNVSRQRSVTQIAQPAQTDGASGRTQALRPALRAVRGGNASAAVKKRELAHAEDNWQEY
jgi:methyl-accepting chemotaxis protein